MTAVNTSSDGTGWAAREAVPATQNPANYGYFDLLATKTGSPGAVFCMWSVFYRLIVT